MLSVHSLFPGNGRRGSLLIYFGFYVGSHHMFDDSPKISNTNLPLKSPPFLWAAAQAE